MVKLPKVYSLGSLPLSSLLAYEVSQLPKQPKVSQVVLLLNDQNKLNRFLNHDSKLYIQYQNQINAHNLQFMASCSPPIYSTGEVAHIENLIISEPNNISLTKSINKYSKSLSPESNILLLNPSFGTVNSIYRNIWKAPNSRPNIFLGLTYANEFKAVRGKDEFQIKINNSRLPLHLSPLPIDFGSYSYDQDQSYSESLSNNNALIKLLTETSINSLKSSTPFSVDLRRYTYGELLLLRLERLMTSSCIDSLTTVYDCKYNSELLEIKEFDSILKLLIKEQVSIIYKGLSYVTKIPNNKIALDSTRLYDMTINELKKSSVTKNGNKIAATYLNTTNVNQQTGYFVNIAAYKRLDCKLNKQITDLVKGKISLKKRQALDHRLL